MGVVGVGAEVVLVRELRREAKVVVAGDPHAQRHKHTVASRRRAPRAPRARRARRATCAPCARRAIGDAGSTGDFQGSRSTAPSTAYACVRTSLGLG